MKNLFEQAIARKEVLKFALGEDEYLMPDSAGKSEGAAEAESNHSVLGSWNQSVMELHDDNSVACAAGVNSMFSSLVGNSPAATATRIWPLIDHLGEYWTQRHGGWLQFELGRVAEPIAAAVEVERGRCRRGESDVDFNTIEMAIRKIQRNGGLSELA
jgi:hypothetical protein